MFLNKLRTILSKKLNPEPHSVFLSSGTVPAINKSRIQVRNKRGVHIGNIGFSFVFSLRSFFALSFFFASSNLFICSKKFNIFSISKGFNDFTTF